MLTKNIRVSPSSSKRASGRWAVKIKEWARWRSRGPGLTWRLEVGLLPSQARVMLGPFSEAENVLPLVTLTFVVPPCPPNQLYQAPHGAKAKTHKTQLVLRAKSTQSTFLVIYSIISTGHPCMAFRGTAREYNLALWSSLPIWNFLVQSKFTEGALLRASRPSFLRSQNQSPGWFEHPRHKVGSPKWQKWKQNISCL